MASRKLAHAGTATITWAALSTLASNSQTTSTAQDNSSNLYLQGYVNVNITTAASATSATGFVEVWLLQAVDGTGGTFPSPYTNGMWLGNISATANATAYNGTFALPPNVIYYELVVNNQTGGAFTAGTAKVDYVYETVA